MRIRIPIIAAILIFPMPLAVVASQSGGEPLVGDVEAGKAKALMCTACHGTDGNSPALSAAQKKANAEQFPNLSHVAFPKLAGQGERYFIAQLKAFKSGFPDAKKSTRRSAAAAQMYGMTVALSEADMANLAAYYASQANAPAQADNSSASARQMLARGEAIYRGGNTDYGSAACIGCHGPSGKGNPPAGYPALAGQHASYTFNQLRAYHDGARDGDPNEMMRNMVRKMSTEEMYAVAQYIQGLR